LTPHPAPASPCRHSPRSASTPLAPSAALSQPSFRPGVTPNFHTVEITRHGACTAVLGHNSVSVIAFAEPRPPGHATVTFIDRPELAAAIRATCDLPIFTKQQMNSPVPTADLTALGADEHRQIRYWRPNTIGELLFNFWD
jgi:hypothetical protein